MFYTSIHQYLWAAAAAMHNLYIQSFRYLSKPFSILLYYNYILSLGRKPFRNSVSHHSSADYYDFHSISSFNRMLKKAVSHPKVVIPAKAGIYNLLNLQQLDSR